LLILLPYQSNKPVRPYISHRGHFLRSTRDVL
jgi:hypothetical protein